MAVPLRLLLLEDNDDDALLVLRELKRAGYEPQQAHLLAITLHVDLHLAVDLTERGCPPGERLDYP